MTGTVMLTWVVNKINLLFQYTELGWEWRGFMDEIVEILTGIRDHSVSVTGTRCILPYD